jgi:antitoxin FitA
MAILTVRNLDENVKSKLRVNAAIKGVSMEEEVRQVLTRAVLAPANDADAGNLFSRIRARMDANGFKGVDLELPLREPMRAPPNFGDDK